MNPAKHADETAASPAGVLEVPVSRSQRRLWVLDRMRQGASIDMNLSLSVVLRGALDVAALRRALDAIVARHAVLRTSFRERDGEPVQVIAPSCEMPFEIVDLHHLEAATQDQRVADILRDTALDPFDLSIGPLVRCLLLVLERDRHILSMQVHHIVWDAWSNGIWVRELGVLYAAFRSGRSDPLPPLQRQYADFAAWERSPARVAAADADLAYWSERLRGIAAGQGLATDRPRPPVPSLRGARIFTMLPPDTVDGVRLLCRTRGMTPYMVLLGTLFVLLERYSQTNDVVVGSPVANRPDEAFASLIGCFINVLVIRLKLDRQTTLDRVLAAVRTETLEALMHQHAPFDDVVAALAGARQHDAPSLFHVAFALHNTPIVAATLGGVEVEWRRRIDARLGQDLEIHVFEHGRQLGVDWRYNLDLFDQWRIAQLARHFERVLRAMIENPRQQVGAVCLLDDAETQQVIGRSGSPLAGGDDEPIIPHTLPSIFERQVAVAPDRAAVIAGAHTITYGELNARANRLARALIRWGAAPDTFVAVALDRSVALPAAILGVLKAGAAYVPVAMDQPAARVANTIDDSRPLFALVDRSSSPLPVPVTTHVVDDILDDRSASSDNVADDERVASLVPDHPAYVLYTSGSSGRPKGVVGPHRGLVNRLQWFAALGMASDGPVLAKTSLAFVDGSTELLGPLVTGRAIVIADSSAARDPRALADLVARHGAAQLTLVPSFLNVILEEWNPARAASCRLWVSSGEPLTPSLASRFASADGGATLLNLYGMTEAAGDSLWGLCRDGATDFTGLVWNTQVAVLDPSLAPAPAGVSGEIYIGGEGLARGYLGDPAATATRFVANPYGAPGSRLYRTGDLGSALPGGRWRFLGRADDVVKIAGVRTSPAEVEAALMRLDGVASAVVVVRPDRAPILMAYVVPARSGAIDVASVQRGLRRFLPAAMVPGAVVLLDELPRTPTGKIDRQALAHRPLPAADDEASPEPVTSEERALCEMFAELFGVDGIGRFSNFFELGGHSLQAIQLANRVRHRFGIELDGMTLFDAPTVAELARHLVLPIT